MQHSGNSYNCAGNIANNDTYTDIEAERVVPSVSGGSGESSSHWLGIGLGNSQSYPLVQAGEDSRGNGVAPAWVETYYPNDPTGSIYLPSPWSNIAGDTVSVHVTFRTSGAASIHMTDYTTGSNIYFTIIYSTTQAYSGMYPDGRAEAITKGWWYSNGIPPANFNAVTFTDTQAYSSATGWQYIGSLSHYYYVMIDGSGNTMAYPGTIYSYGEFSNHWLRST